MILWRLFFFFTRGFHFNSECICSPDWRGWQKKSYCFSSLFPFSPLVFPPSSLSICPLVCLICSPPEGGTIFWMSPMLINWCQRPPCRAYSCSEWQIILCHGESVWEEEESRGEEGEREMLAACPSLLVASVIATASHLHRSTSEKVWHLGGYVFQILLERHMCGHKHTCRERECVPTVRYTYRLKPILWKNFPKTN